LFISCCAHFIAYFRNDVKINLLTYLLYSFSFSACY